MKKGEQELTKFSFHIVLNWRSPIFLPVVEANLSQWSGHDAAAGEQSQAGGCRHQWPVSWRRAGGEQLQFF